MTNQRALKLSSRLKDQLSSCEVTMQKQSVAMINTLTSYAIKWFSTNTSHKCSAENKTKGARAVPQRDMTNTILFWLFIL